ncbi:MAG: hypothetical protein ACP5PV_01600 [Methanothrix sp.]
MPKELRDPQIIQEELSDVRALIEREGLLISKYPGHAEILLAHVNSKKREQELIKELEISLRKPMIIYKLESTNASLNNAPAQLVGKILVAMQGFIYSLAGASVGRRSKHEEELHLLSVNFKPGSINMEFSPAMLAPTFDDMMEQTPVFNKASKFLSILPQRNIEYQELKAEVEKQIEDDRTRITALNALLQLIPPPGNEAEIAFRNINGNGQGTKLQDLVLKGRVEKLLREEIKKHDIEVFGVIQRFKDDAPAPSFIVKDGQGKFIKVRLPDEKRDEVLDYLHRRMPIRLTGAGNKKKSLEIFDLDQIEPSTRLTIESINGIKLKSPLDAKISYEREHDEESDYWVISNDEFGAYGVDSNLDLAREMFKDDLYCEYINFKDITDDKLTEKAIDLKKKLIRIFEG